MFRVSFYKLVIPRFISVTPNKIWGIGCDTLQARTQKSMENWACGKPNLGAPKKSLTAGVDHVDGYTTMHLLIWGPGAHFWSPMGHSLFGAALPVGGKFLNLCRVHSPDAHWKDQRWAWISRPWFQSHGGISRNTNLQLGKGLEIGPKVFYSSVGPLRSLKNPARRLRSWVAVGVDQQHRTTEVAAPIACDEPSGSPQHHQTAGGEEKPWNAVRNRRTLVVGMVKTKDFPPWKNLRWNSLTRLTRPLHSKRLWRLLGCPFDECSDFLDKYRNIQQLCGNYPSFDHGTHDFMCLCSIFCIATS